MTDLSKQPQLVHTIQQTLGQGGARLFEILPAQLRNMLKQKLWLECSDKNGKPFTSFEAFVAHRLPQGFESSTGDLLNFCRKKPDVQALIRAEIQPVGKHGGDRKSAAVENQGDVVTLKRERGNSAAYLLGVLKRDYSDIAEEYKQGKFKSVRAAALKAGIVKKRISVLADTPENALGPLVKQFGIARLERALDVLKERASKPAGA